MRHLVVLVWRTYAIWDQSTKVLRVLLVLWTVRIIPFEQLLDLLTYHLTVPPDLCPILRISRHQVNNL